jgi:MFS family permease
MSAASHPLAEPRTDWALVGLLFTTGLLAAGQFAKISLTLGPLEEVYPGSTAFLPFVVSALSVTGIFLGASAGMLVARVGVRVVLLTGLVGGAVLSAAQAMLPAFPILMALRLAEGAAHLCIVVAAPTLMAARASRHDRPVVMGLWGTFFGVGFAIYAALMPALLGAFGIAGVYLFHAAALLAVAALLAPRLPRADIGLPDGEGFLARHLAIYRTPASSRRRSGSSGTRSCSWRYSPTCRASSAAGRERSCRSWRSWARWGQGRWPGTSRPDASSRRASS